MKEQGIIQLERRDSHQKYYKICTEEESKALLNPQAQPVETGGYDQDVLDRVDELVQSNSPKDKRIGGLLLECMARGEVTVDDYAAIGESSKWFGDMQLASQLGLVEKTSPQRYAILRHLKTGALSLAKYDMEVYDKTPYVGGERGNDISAWFNRHPGNWQYAILDDDDDMGDHIDHLVRTDFDLGLTEREANRCIELLQRED